MFALDTTYNIVFFAAACFITAMFFTGCVVASCIHKRRLRVWGVLYNVFAAIVWAGLLVLTVAFILVKLDVLQLDGNALVMWGLRVPELGYIMRLFEYIVSQVLLGAAIVLGALSFVLNVTRRQGKPPLTLAEVEREQTPETPDFAPTETDEQTVEDDARSEETEAQAVEENQTIVEDEQTIEEEPSIAEEEQTAEEEQPIIEEEQTIEQEQPIAEEEQSVEEEPASEEEYRETAAADTLEMPEYKPQENVYRDLFGRIADVIDDAISGTQPEEVAPEVVPFERERRPVEAHEIEGEEIMGERPRPTLEVRTITRKAPRTSSPVRTTASQKTVTPHAPPEKPTSKKPEHKAVETSEALMTRRHVIMNRSNVVNMFSEYLKSRNEEEKERLEGSINTIIIK